jgi:YfiH family protein
LKERLKNWFARMWVFLVNRNTEGLSDGQGVPFDNDMVDLVDAELESQDSPISREEWGDIILYRFIDVPRGIKAYFTTRNGGVSKPPYQSLNLGFHVGDDPEAVSGNRKLLASVLDLDSALITSPRQRHSAEVSLLLDQTDVGAGADSEDSAFDPCDGLITSLKGAPILLHFADCVPVILAAEGKTQSVGVLHAGREGLMQGVVGRGVLSMSNQGVAPRSITAAIGPAIGPCCYEVDDETASRFADQFGADLVTGNHLDLPGAVKQELTGAGVNAGNIACLDRCTACSSGFYSYRRDGVTGRHGAIAWIE